MKSQHQLSILVTRPDPGGTGLCALITAKGDKAIHLPTIAIKGPPDPEICRNQVKRIAAGDWLVFISPQAVYTGWPIIKEIHPYLTDKVQIAAIGPGTLRALQAVGVQSVISPERNFSSEGLLALSNFQSVDGQRIHIIRGSAGRDLLEKTLASRGAILFFVLAYQRTVPEIKMDPFLGLMQKKHIDVIVCGSYESVNNLKTMFGAHNWSLVTRIPLIVVSERIKELAQYLDFQTIWVAPNAAHEAILETLAKKKEELWQMKKS